MQPLLHEDLIYQDGLYYALLVKKHLQGGRKRFTKELDNFEMIESILNSALALIYQSAPDKKTAIELTIDLRVEVINECM